MKTLKKILILLFISMAILACSKDDDGGDGGNAGEGSLVAKINGSSFKSLKQATAANQVTGGGNTTLTIQGSDADGKAIVLIINGFDGTGTYELADNNVFISASYTEANVNDPMNSQTWNAPFQDSGVVGEIKISEKSETKIKGTFNFEAKNPNNQSMRTVSEGSFNMKLTIN